MSKKVKSTVSEELTTEAPAAKKPNLEATVKLEFGIDFTKFKTYENPTLADDPVATTTTNPDSNIKTLTVYLKFEENVASLARDNLDAHSLVELQEKLDAKDEKTFQLIDEAAAHNILHILYYTDLGEFDVATNAVLDKFRKGKAAYAKTPPPFSLVWLYSPNVVEKGEPYYPPFPLDAQKPRPMWIRELEKGGFNSNYDLKSLGHHDFNGLRAYFKKSYEEQKKQLQFEYKFLDGHAYELFHETVRHGGFKSGNGQSNTPKKVSSP